MLLNNHAPQETLISIEEPSSWSNHSFYRSAWSMKSQDEDDFDDDSDLDDNFSDIDLNPDFDESDTDFDEYDDYSSEDDEF